MNANAHALYQRMGFTAERVMRRAFRVDGDDGDSSAMVLLKED